MKAVLVALFVAIQSVLTVVAAAGIVLMEGSASGVDMAAGVAMLMLSGIFMLVIIAGVFSSGTALITKLSLLPIIGIVVLFGYLVIIALFSSMTFVFELTQDAFE